MLTFIFRRALQAIPTLLFLLFLVFILLRLAPGGPFDEERSWPPEVKLNIMVKYGLDKPIPEQFWIWLTDLASGDLRESFQYTGKPVSEIVSESVGVSIWVGVMSLSLSLLFGIFFGAVSAWKKDTWLDQSTMFMAVAGLSLPSYLLGSILILIFAMQLGWVPPALIDEKTGYILPIATLAARPMAMIARLTRTSLLEALRSDYIQTARSKGVSEFAILFKHALKNSMIPVVTLLGPLTANLITGSFIVETIFQLPGLGRHFVTAVLNRDYPLVMGVTLFYGVVLVTSNLIIDCVYGWIDPRIRAHRV